MEQQKEVSKQNIGSQGNEKSRMNKRLIIEEEKGDINALADAFIKNFRNQLRIQRQESFKRFHEMIARGT